MGRLRPLGVQGYMPQAGPPAQGKCGRRKSHGITRFCCEEHACNQVCDAERDGQARPDAEYGERPVLAKIHVRTCLLPAPRAMHIRFHMCAA